MILNIDIVDRCNLRCPTCAMGRGEEFRSGQKMSAVVLETILNKIVREYGRLNQVMFYNITEPTLHPNLPVMIQTAKRFAPVCISTNASVKGFKWGPILKSGPSQIVVSISGYTQSIHERGHSGSSIDEVHRQMRDISKAAGGTSTKLVLIYHRYRNNLGEEEDNARKHAESLGFSFLPSWAITLRPTETVSNFADCLMTFAESMQFLSGKRVRRCFLLDKTLNINVRGQVLQCCMFGTIHCNYLDRSKEDIQSMRRADCQSCMATGLANYGMQHPSLDREFARRVGDCWRYRIDRWLHWLFYLKEKYFR